MVTICDIEDKMGNGIRSSGFRINYKNDLEIYEGNGEGMKINECIYKVSGVEYGTNSNIYAIKYGGGIILIDCGYQKKQWEIMLECLKDWKLRAEDITHVFVTHSHFDHSGNVWRVNKLGAKVLASKIDAEKIETGNPEMEKLFNSKWVCGRVDEILKPEDTYEFPGDVKIQVLGTAGHSAGSLSFLIEAGGDRALCTGDMFFVSPLPPQDKVEAELGYMGSEDFSLPCFVKSMELIRKLKINIIMPGHYYFYKGKDTRELLEDAYAKTMVLGAGISEQGKKTDLLRKIRKLEAYHEIQNEMGRATAAFNFREKEKVLSYFALEKEDVSLEVADEGLFEGRIAVMTMIEQLLGKSAKPGEMLDMQLTTPMIEIADDLRTAKCVWWCPGAGAVYQKEEIPQAIWAWGQIAVDFIWEDDVWKIWHLHYFRLIKCAYEKGWVEDTSQINRLNVPLSKYAKPTTYHNPYSPWSIREGIPCMPLPYETYTEQDRFWELNRDKQ